MPIISAQANRKSAVTFQGTVLSFGHTDRTYFWNTSYKNKLKKLRTKASFCSSGIQEARQHICRKMDATQSSSQGLRETSHLSGKPSA